MKVAGTTVSLVDVFGGPDALGNPAGVVLDERGLDEMIMASIAQEVGLSETAFVGVGGEQPGLRWFTPSCEVDLCGHATLAAMAVLSASTGTSSATFLTRAGLLTARTAEDRSEVLLPRRASSPEEAPAWAERLGAVGVMRSDGVLLVEVQGPGALRALHPELSALRADPAEMVIIWSMGGVGAEVSVRVFGPRIGIDEDPVTGSAHCSLGPLVAQRLGERSYRVHQCSTRGGRLEVRLEDDGVMVAGVTKLRAEEDE
jgi:predicted PhzF superfamily epimerase YddE/YHI9